jgi:ubiquinone/menaquinone biosynthesis C-methylase UbiE
MAKTQAESMRTDETEEAKAKATATYNAAADSFDEPALAFWNLIGQRTIERLRLKSGDRVLDVACGSGASAIPAAQSVGESGTVLGVDLAERLLELARAKARQLGLTNIRFQVGDMERSGCADESFDAVVCVFGIFFLPDMARAVRELWRMVRQGGQLAITTWGPRVFEPGASAFWEAVSRERRDLVRAFDPWTRIDSPAGLEELLRASGIENANITPESNLQELATPDDWWTIVLGTGYRSTIEQLDPAARERVRIANLESLGNIQSIEVNALYAVAKKPRD